MGAGAPAVNHTIGQCVLTTDRPLFHWLETPSAPVVWLDSLYVRYVSAADANELIILLGSDEERPALLLTTMTLSGLRRAEGLYLERADALLQRALRSRAYRSTGNVWQTTPRQCPGM